MYNFAILKFKKHYNVNKIQSILNQNPIFFFDIFYF